ncbi:MAG: hypothetical protein JJW01_03145 [Alphaproteobacteria bacterium]|nr:hypothetical protein [Rickettsiales bacterium]
MSIKNPTERKFRFSKLLNVISIIASVTSLIVVAHMSARNTSNDFRSNDPAIIKTSDSQILIVDNNDKNSNENQAILDDIDSDDFLHDALDAKINYSDKDDRYNDNSNDNDLAIKNKEQIFDKLSNVETVTSNHQVSASLSSNYSTSSKVNIVLPQKAPKFIKNSPSLKSSANNVKVDLAQTVEDNNIVNKVINDLDSSKFATEESEKVKEVSKVKDKSSKAVAIVNLPKGDSVTLYPGQRDVSVDNQNNSSANNNDNKNFSSKVQLDIFPTHTEAIAAWFRIRNANIGILKNIRYHIDKVQGSRNNSDAYRLYVDAGSNDNAVTICDSLKRNGVSCNVTS